jgi:hypothetical protein
MNLKVPNLFCLFLFLSFTLVAQSPVLDCEFPLAEEALHANEVRALLTNSGANYIGEDGGFFVPFSSGSPVNAIFANGFLAGGIDPAANLLFSGVFYGPLNGQSDFSAGPLDENGETSPGQCANWDRFWTVYGYQVEAHIADFAGDGDIDDPIAAIYEWPGKGNPHFEDVFGFPLPDTDEGLAPFFDKDNDGLYDPDKGDYPLPENVELIPGQISWCIFNDNGAANTVLQGNPLGVEVQLTNYAFSCDENELINRTVFASYKVINRSLVDIDSFYVGLFTDFDLGCYEDDYLGCIPGRNTCYSYNQDNLDEDCSGVQGYGNNPPVQAITFLNQPLSHFGAFGNGSVGPPLPPGTTDPMIAVEGYRYLTGHWRDGIPYTVGGDGYDLGSTEVTPWLFPDDPNDPDGWSMLSEFLNPADRRGISSVKLGMFPAGASTTLDIAASFHRQPGSDFLENITFMDQQIDQLQQYYDAGFDFSCEPVALCLEDCVWPGDANADGIANHCDLLAVGVGVGEQGSERNTPLYWGPFDAEPWGQMLPLGGDYKHIDCDGDNTISTADFDITQLHYNLTNFKYNPVDEYPQGPELKLTDVPPIFDFDNVESGETGFARISLAEEVPDLYGLAFTLEYDPVYISTVQMANGYCSDPCIEFGSEPFDAGNKRVTDFAITQLEEGTFIDPGYLFMLNVMVNSLPDTIDFPNQTEICFKNIKAVKSDGSSIDLGGTCAELSFSGLVVGSQSPILEEWEVGILPNPASSGFNLSFSEPGEYFYEIFDQMGSLLFSASCLHCQSAYISASSLQNGLYLVRVTSGSRSVVKKLLVQKS